MFEEHVRALYGSRGEALLASLKLAERQISRPNAFAEPGETKVELGRWVESDGLTIVERAASGLLANYIMDAASVVAARALQVQPGERVLDLCAAPGGKTLVLAEGLFLQDHAFRGELIANEPSPARRDRLMKVIQQYVPRDVRSKIFVRGVDGIQFGLRDAEGFDRILVDAPCSGERHLLKNPTELSQWKPRRSVHLSKKQYSLLAAAWLALRPGGRILYSTCSIEPRENDEVVGRLIQKKSARPVPIQSLPDSVFGGPSGVRELGETTKWGFQFLPDRGGLGPIFFSIVEKP